MIATALFISSSQTLREQVATQFSSWQEVKFEFAWEPGDELLASYSSLAILYLHVDAVSSADWDHLLKLAEAHEARPAVVAVVDAFDPVAAVGLLQQGVTDCMPTPIDFSRMAMQTGYEVARRHHVPRPNHVHYGDASEIALANFGSLSFAVPVQAPYELESSRRSAELAAIHHALAAHNNNRSKAAAALGVSRVTLYKKLHKYGMMDVAQDAG